MSAIDPVILELRADVDKASSNVKRYADGSTRDLQRADQAMTQHSNVISMSAARASTSLGAMRQASVGAGQQLQDMAVQLQAGTSATTVFAQQVPQLAFALSGLVNSTNSTAQSIGKFATFLSGPWGVAINIAVIAAGAFISQMDLTGSTALSAAPKVDALTDAVKRLANAEDDIGAVGTIEKKIGELQSKRLEVSGQDLPGFTTAGAQARSQIKAIDDQISAYKALIAFNEVAVQGEKDKAAYKKAQQKAEADAEAAKRRAAAAAKQAAEEVARENDRVRDRITTLKDQIQAQEMINAGNERGAAILLAKWEIERQFPKANKELVKQAQDLAVQLIMQKDALEDIKDLRDQIMKMAKNGAIIDFDDKKLTAAIANVAKVSNAVVDATFKSSKAIDAIRERAIDNLTDGITNAITGAESLGDAFSRVADQIIADLIRIAVQKAIIEPLFGAPNDFTGQHSGGGSGLLNGVMGGILGVLGFAGGGYRPPNSLSIVNEQNSGGVELLKMGPQGGTIVPLGAAQQTMAPASGGTGGTISVRLSLDNELLRAEVQEAAFPVAVEVVTSAGPEIAKAGANLAIARAGRPRL